MLFSIFRSSSDGVSGWVGWGGCKVSKTGWWWLPFSEVRLRKCIYQIFHDVYLRYVFLFLEPAVVGWLGGWELCQQNWRSWTHSFYFFTLFVLDARIAFFFWQIFSVKSFWKMLTYGQKFETADNWENGNCVISLSKYV